MLLFRVIPVLVLLLLSACSTQILRLPELSSAYVHSQGRLAECAELFARVDNLTLQADAMDAQTARLAGFPYLRINRLLASFRDELQEPQKLLAWLQAMRRLDQQARRYELQNTQIEDGKINTGSDMLAKLDACGTEMLQADLQEPLRLEKIKQRAVVPDSYIQGNRILGVYPLSSLFVKGGVRRLHKAIKATFSKTVTDLVINGTLVGYVPEQSVAVSEAEVVRIMQTGNADALSVPVFSKQEEDRLFRYFAPVWELDEVNGEDRIGAPYWSANNRLMIETDDKVVYRHLSYTRFNGQVLPQFNYIIWFPSRPATGVFDILAGHLDGITWRVTVGRDGRPLMYDVMHNCGCYHMFFPTEGVTTRRVKEHDNEEPALVPMTVPRLQPGQRLHLRIAAVSHYVEAVQPRAIATATKTYHFADYNDLRSLALANGKRKSMFGGNGIVPGSSRKERWLLWPMGVEDAGAMRQWGNHAIAFVGRRHFDDADLLERFFSGSWIGKQENNKIIK